MDVLNRWTNFWRFRRALASSARDPNGALLRARLGEWETVASRHGFALILGEAPQSMRLCGIYDELEVEIQLSIGGSTGDRHCVFFSARLPAALPAGLLERLNGVVGPVIKYRAALFDEFESILSESNVPAGYRTSGRNETIAEAHRLFNPSGDGWTTLRLSSEYLTCAMPWINGAYEYTEVLVNLTRMARIFASH
ncbi:hypothetical protein LZC95_05330 [Pendulispora brunnea]|uniref:Uncharacterized protein n=1 Tax=Pendulispora brunnea TaxID=2905690 RepID=A0ABZ2KC50_9BACT